MKYWRGYLTAAIIGFFSWALIEFASTHSALIDTVYPYMTRLVQGFLAEWSGTVDFCLWQVLAVMLALGILTTIVLMVVLRWNVIQLVGWYTAIASFLFFCHTALYGLNSYAGPLSNDIRLNVSEYTLSELEEATIYYRDKANELADQISRHPNGTPQYADFQTLAEQAKDGFDVLVYEDTYSVFAGSTLPVKELGWADMYTSMGITGFTFSLTGEAAVNPQIPPVSLPFTMCHEMAHRMSIAVESDANMTAFLACQANPSIEFQYSAYFMAYKYCYSAIMTLGTSAAQDSAHRIRTGLGENFSNDMIDYNNFFAERQNDTATAVAETVNDSYIKVNGDERGTASYGAVCDQLVAWYIQTEILPNQVEEEIKFDPYDETQVDLSGLVHAGKVATNGNEEDAG